MVLVLVVRERTEAERKKGKKKQRKGEANLRCSFPKKINKMQQILEQKVGWKNTLGS